MVESNRRMQSRAPRPQPNNDDHDYVSQLLECPMAFYLRPVQVESTKGNGKFRVNYDLSKTNGLGYDDFAMPT